MSGWFGTSNPEVDGPFQGIGAGYARRRNAQRQRYNSVGRIVIPQPGEKPPVQTTSSGASKQMYLGWDLTTTYLEILKGYSTVAYKLGKGRHVFQGRSKGESLNAAKNWIDRQVSAEIDPSMDRVVKIAEDKAAEQAVSVTDQQLLEQNNYNEELTKRTAFTETPTTTLLPSTDPSDVAQFNREKAQQEAAAAFRPVRMPKDFVAGSYTVRASYNAITQKYIVNVFQGTVSKANATFDKNSGTAAAAKHDQWSSLATKKAKYDAEVDKTYTKGGVTVELKVTKAASLGGFLDDLLNGFGKLVNGGAPKQNDYASDPNKVPKEINNRTQAWDNKVRIDDEVIKKPIPTQSTFSSWDAMPQKSYVVITNYGPKANQPMSRRTYEQALELYNEIVAGVDAYLQQKPVQMPVPPADGSGGDITDPAEKRKKGVGYHHKGFFIEMASWVYVGSDWDTIPHRHTAEVKDSKRNKVLASFDSPSYEGAEAQAKRWVNSQSVTPAPPPAGMPLPPDAKPIDPPFDYIIPPDIRPTPPPATPTPVYIVPKPTPPMQPVKPTPKPTPPIDPGLLPPISKPGPIETMDIVWWITPDGTVGTGSSTAMARVPGARHITQEEWAKIFGKKRVRTPEEIQEYLIATEKALTEIKAAHPDYISIMESPRQSPFGSFIDSTGLSDEQVGAMITGDYHFFLWKEGKGGLPISGPVIKLLNDYKKSPFFPGKGKKPMPEPMPIEIQPPEKSEVYDEIVKEIVADDTPGRIVVPQPVSTYQSMSVEDNPWAPQGETTQITTSGPAVDDKQLLGVGLLALAGLMYYRK